MEIIGLNGFKRAGKDTGAGAFIQLGWTRLAFATELRNAAYTINPLMHDGSRFSAIIDALGWEKVKDTAYYPEYRRIMQYVGDACRALDPDIFVKPVMRQVDQLSDDLATPGVVISDVRFPNEARAVREAGGHVIEIVKPGVVSDGHVSEQRLPQELISATVVNDSTIRALHDRVLVAAESLLRPTLTQVAA